MKPPDARSPSARALHPAATSLLWLAAACGGVDERDPLPVGYSPGNLDGASESASPTNPGGDGSEASGDDGAGNDAAGSDAAGNDDATTRAATNDPDDGEGGTGNVTNVNDPPEPNGDSAASGMDDTPADEAPADEPMVVTLPGPGPRSELVELVWSVGAEGIGPGLFDDARFLSVDGQGIIYVGEFEVDGPTRVQVFDPDGNFLEQWFTESESIVTGMATTLDGTVHLLQSGGIERYQGRGGAYLGPVGLPRGSEADAIAIAPDGGLVAVNRERIMRLDPSDEVVFDDAESIADVLDGSIFIEGAAVDGEGNVLVIEAFEAGVFQFNASGTFVNRIGGEGDGPGLLSGGPDAVTVDGAGRVYASDFDGIEVFESNGNPVGLIDVRGAIFGMAVTLQGELLVLERNGAKLHKLELL